MSQATLRCMLVLCLLVSTKVLPSAWFCKYVLQELLATLSKFRIICLSLDYQFACMLTACLL